MKRNIYLKMRTLAEAKAEMRRVFGQLTVTGVEDLPAADAVGRVLAESVTARASSPHFYAAAMDGVAVQAATTFGATETQPKTLRLGQDAYAINTGHVMPADTDAVIMVEHLNPLDDTRVEIEAPVFPWQHVRRVGEDIVATEMLFPQNHQITPYCVGALLSGGVFHVKVRRRPAVLIIPTGSELVTWQDTDPQRLKPGQVIDSNSHVLAGLVAASGGNAVRADIVGDDPDRIQAAIRQGIVDGYDLILTVGGSSAGSRDLAKTAFSELGELLVHGVTMMPGKPVLMAAIEGRPVFGMPGYQVSTIVAFEQLVGPLLRQMSGLRPFNRETVSVEPTRKIPSKIGLEEFVRVKLGRVGDRIMATPLPRGAGNITTITEADGIVRIPNHVEGIMDGESVSAELLRPAAAIADTIVAVGSHDNSLDVLADLIKADHSRLTLSSSHVGSMGGLMAVKRGVCHLAGSHLLDTHDGSYNGAYIRRYLPEIGVHQVNLVFRDQGLIVAKGNPKGIAGVEDLSRADLVFINRQGGSGTRILFDHRLNQLGLSAGDINGYAKEEFTHMAVAVAVLSGSADAGLGIYAAAKALDLDFIPVVTEQYDLVIPAPHFESDNLQLLLETISTGRFKQRVEALGGYHTHQTGQVIETFNL